MKTGGNPVRIAINGFGRIGRAAFKLLFERQDAKIVAINDLSAPKTLAYLLKHDSAYGKYEKTVTFSDQSLIVDGQEIPVFHETDPEKLPWKENDVDVALECTGIFRDLAGAGKHLTAGAKKVIISSPAKSPEIKTIVLGVNDDEISEDDQIFSNASCTTNCIAPIMDVLEKAYGVEKSMMTTIHSYTNSGRILDSSAKDLREGRTAAENIIPTTTGASKATAEVIPSLENKFSGLSVRVPTPVVSLADITALLKTNVEKAELAKLFETLAKNPLYRGILATTREELVSTDFIKNPNSCIVDLPLIDVVGGNLVKIVAWYDNEWGYSNRLVELALKVGNQLKKGDKK